MKIIDSHTHCFADSIAPRAMAELSKAIPYPPAHDGTFSGLLAAQKEKGIDISIVAPIATKPTQNDTINEWAAAIACPEIRCMGTIHPRTENYRDVIRKIKDLGLVGIKFHPEYQDYYIDDESVYPMYEYAAELGLPMMFHTGADIAYKPPYKASPERTRKMVKAFPGAVIIAAHLGGNWIYDEALEALSDTGVYVDLAATCYTVTGEKLKNLINAWGFERVLFATDSPWTQPEAGISALKECGLEDGQLEAVFHKNAEKIFKF